MTNHIDHILFACKFMPCCHNIFVNNGECFILLVIVKVMNKENNWNFDKYACSWILGQVAYLAFRLYFEKYVQKADILGIPDNIQSWFTPNCMYAKKSNKHW